MGKEEFFTLKAIIFDLDAEMRLAKQSILTRKSYCPLSGLRQILQTLAQEEICLTMISSLSKKEIMNGCHSTEIQEYFQHLISTDELKYTESIQNPLISELLALALQRSNVTPSEALLVCDSDLGIGAAKAAAIPCVAFQHLHSEQSDLWNADILLESFDGLTPSFFFQVYHRFHDQPITIASTERLCIRELTPKNIPALCDIYQNPDIRRFITDISDDIEEEAARQIAYIGTVYRFYGYGLWGIFRKNSDTLIGRCGIENHKIGGQEEIMLSYLLDKKYWRQGYAQEACQAVLHYAREELDIHRIIAVIDCENKRSLRTAASLGMAPERELIYKNRRCILFTLN